MKKRCDWCLDNDTYIDYHDNEWGVPVYDDQTMFEFLVLEGMQAGLSWITILRKRENFRKAFANFNPEKMARFSEKKVASLLRDEGIIRNRLKINAAIKNAKAYLKIKESGSFCDYMWQFTEGQVIQNRWPTTADIPSTNHISNIMAKDLKKRGFSFVGSTICYAHMQATGMINDHIQSCFRFKELC